jgi:hypothetical protein
MRSDTSAQLLAPLEKDGTQCGWCGGVLKYNSSVEEIFLAVRPLVNLRAASISQKAKYGQ